MRKGAAGGGGVGRDQDELGSVVRFARESKAVGRYALGSRPSADRRRLFAHALSPGHIQIIV